MKQIVIAVVLLSAALVLSRAEDTPKPITASVAIENRILKAEHVRDEILKQKADVLEKGHQIQDMSKKLQEQWDDLNKKDATASKSVDEEIEAAWKESGLDKSKYTFDPANFTFSLKPPDQKAEAKLPEKK